MDPTITAGDLERMRAAGTPFALLDVRRPVDFDADDVIILGARHADPERTVVIYCVRGGSVSQSVSASLVERGFDVRYVEGGITAWKAQGCIGVPKRRT